tara:strand:+ start:1043 stop:1435 length:393 start_codon:yes stop_codon:yes gene_type:complete
VINMTWKDILKGYDDEEIEEIAQRLHGKDKGINFKDAEELLIDVRSALDYNEGESYKELKRMESRLENIIALPRRLSKQDKQVAGPFYDKGEASSYIMFETDHLQRTGKKYIALEKDGEWFVHENGEWTV